MDADAQITVAWDAMLGQFVHESKIVEGEIVFNVEGSDVTAKILDKDALPISKKDSIYPLITGANSRRMATAAARNNKPCAMSEKTGKTVAPFQPRV